jgi:hypothetical protein
MFHSMKYKLLLIITCIFCFNLKANTLTEAEVSKILKHPVYKDLNKKREFFTPSWLDFTIGFSATELKQNRNQAINISFNNIFTTLNLKTVVWPIKWVGLGFEWDKALIFLKNANNSGSVDNDTLIMPYWMDGYLKLRYKFLESENSSEVALKTGYHKHSFPINTNPDYVTKIKSEGYFFGASTKLAISYKSGFNLMFDFLVLPNFKDTSNIVMKQNGIAYRLDVSFYTTLIDRKNIKTILSLGYKQLSYTSNLEPEVSSSLEAEHFEQTYRGLYVSFTAKI